VCWICGEYVVNILWTVHVAHTHNSRVRVSFLGNYSTAQQMIHSAFTANPSFLVYFNLEAWMLTSLTAGMTPVTTLKDALSQVALGGLFRFISLFYLNDFWRLIRNLHDANKRTTTLLQDQNDTQAPNAESSNAANASSSQGKTKKKD
jgi:phosphatidylglycerophosphate synthase